MNSVSVSGNLTSEPELRGTATGKSVLKLGIAVNERRKNASGEWVDYPNFIDCTMFGTRAEKLKAKLAKGSKVAVIGKLHQSRWESEGQKRQKIEILIDDIEIMSKPKDRNLYEEDVQF